MSRMAVTGLHLNAVTCLLQASGHEHILLHAWLKQLEAKLPQTSKPSSAVKIPILRELKIASSSDACSRARSL